MKYLSSMVVLCNIFINIAFSQTASEYYQKGLDADKKRTILQQ